MHQVFSKPLLAGSDNTIISYYSHKKSYFGKTNPSKNEVINARVYWTDDITENFVTECLIKVQTFFESMGRKKSAGWMDKIYKKQNKSNP